MGGGGGAGGSAGGFGGGIGRGITNGIGFNSNPRQPYTYQKQLYPYQICFAVPSFGVTAQ